MKHAHSLRSWELTLILALFSIAISTSITISATEKEDATPLHPPQASNINRTRDVIYELVFPLNFKFNRPGLVMKVVFIFFKNRDPSSPSAKEISNARTNLTSVVRMFINASSFPMQLYGPGKSVSAVLFSLDIVIEEERKFEGRQSLTSGSRLSRAYLLKKARKRSAP